MWPTAGPGTGLPGTRKAAAAAYEKTGKKVVYIVNVTDGAATIEDTVQRVLEEGAEMIMMNYPSVGYSLFRKIASEVPVPVLAHNAGAGMFYEGSSSGMSSPLAARQADTDGRRRHGHG